MKHAETTVSAVTNAQNESDDDPHENNQSNRRPSTTEIQQPKLAGQAQPTSRVNDDTRDQRHKWDKRTKLKQIRRHQITKRGNGNDTEMTHKEKK